jgi:lysozyme
MEKINKLIRLHEGSKNKPYKCTAGKLTIGVGRNLDDFGLSEDEIDYLLINDVNRVVKELGTAFPWFSELNEARRDALIDICFNIGMPRLKGFSNALNAMAEGKYTIASLEFLDSLWAKQVGQRAKTVAGMISTGKYPDGF